MGGTVFTYNKKPEPEPEPEPQRELDEDEQRAAWNYLMLLSLGVPHEDALYMLRMPRFDWHEVQRLIKVRKCPPNRVAEFVSFE